MGPHKFWMIYGAGQGAPTMRHETEGAACVEAHRLARNNPGVQFYVLETVARAVKNDVQFERIMPATRSIDDEIPF